MNKLIDPKQFGLPHSTKLKEVGGNQFELIIQRKSRIIMKDGEAIVNKVDKINKHSPFAKVSLRTSAPVCSKTITFLKEHKIDVYAS